MHFKVKFYDNRRAADQQPCPYCRRKMELSASQKSGRAPSRDHIKPRAQGGRLPKNSLVCCEQCNKSKSSRPLWAWHAALVERGDSRAKYVLEVIVALYPHLGHTAYEKAVGRQSDGIWMP